MKKFITYSFLTLILFATSACNNSDENQATESKLGDVSMELTYDMGGSRAASNLQGTVFDASTDVGVFVFRNDGKAGYGEYNKSCTNVVEDNVAKLIPENPIYFPLTEEPIDVVVRAYAPFTSSYGRLITYDFDVQANQSTTTGYLRSDLMYGLPTTGNPVHHVPTHDPAQKKQNVKLTFHHLMSKVTLTLQPVAPLTADALVGAQVKLKQVGTRVPFNLVDGTLGTASTPGDVLIGNVAAATDNTVSGLIPPQTIAGGTDFLEVTLADGQVYKYAIPEASSLTLNGGRNYQFNMKFGANGVEVTISVADWVDITGHYTLQNVEFGVWNYELVGFADYELFNEELNPFNPYYPGVPCSINLKGASQNVQRKRS